MKKMSNKTFTVITVILMIGALLYYVNLNIKNGNKRETVQTSSVAEKLLNYDFSSDYPKTERDTVKLHNNFLKCAYNGEFSEKDLEKMNGNIRILFDDELLAMNSEDNQLAGLKEEIKAFNDEKKKIVNFSVQEASQIEHKTVDGQDYAKVKVTLAMKIEGVSQSADQEYLLKKDEEGRWKIMGWQAVKG